MPREAAAEASALRLPAPRGKTGGGGKGGGGAPAGGRPYRASGPRGADGGGWGLTGCGMAPPAAGPAERKRRCRAQGLMGYAGGPARSVRRRGCAERAPASRGASGRRRDVAQGELCPAGTPRDNGSVLPAPNTCAGTKLPGPARRHFLQAVPGRAPLPPVPLGGRAPPGGAAARPAPPSAPARAATEGGRGPRLRRAAGPGPGRGSPRRRAPSSAEELPAPRQTVLPVQLLHP